MNPMKVCDLAAATATVSVLVTLALAAAKAKAVVLTKPEGAARMHPQPLHVTLQFCDADAQAFVAALRAAEDAVIGPRNVS
jgi:hypothetical protein